MMTHGLVTIVLVIGTIALEIGEKREAASIFLVLAFLNHIIGISQK